MGISIRNIRKTFGDFTALEDISLEIGSGELVALLGPSGSGKTTLLRIIAGLEEPDAGTLVLEGEETQSRGARDRQVGFMFQHYALFRHMKVFDNVAFGLRVRKRDRRPDKAAIQNKVMELLRLVHLEGLHDRYPSQLSGGQRQRVALARALAVEPRVLLLDEPFGALDAKVRKELRRFMRQLHETIQVTTVFVTHDQEEAMEVADRVVVMSNGAIEQIGTPNEVWNAPANSFVYDFLGNYNEFEGWKAADGAVHLSESIASNRVLRRRRTRPVPGFGPGAIPSCDEFAASGCAGPGRLNLPACPATRKAVRSWLRWQRQAGETICAATRNPGRARGQRPKRVHHRPHPAHQPGRTAGQDGTATQERWPAAGGSTGIRGAERETGQRHDGSGAPQAYPCICGSGWLARPVKPLLVSAR